VVFDLFISSKFIGYKPEYYYWEIFGFLRKILLSCVVIFLDFSDSDANYKQGLAALFLLIISLVMNVHYLPYVDDNLNRIEGLGLVVSTSTLYLGLWTFSKTISESSQMFVTVSVLTINILWCGYTVNYIRQGYTWRTLCGKKERTHEHHFEVELSTIDASPTKTERINPLNAGLKRETAKEGGVFLPQSRELGNRARLK
jgi:hypothetical protein